MERVINNFCASFTSGDVSKMFNKCGGKFSKLAGKVLDLIKNVDKDPKVTRREKSDSEILEALCTPSRTYEVKVCVSIDSSYNFNEI